MPWRFMLAAACLLLGNPAQADPQPLRDATRGELLYTTHCIDCHGTQVHWRDKKLATDWNSLRTEVSRWQKFSNLGWGEDDIAAVARFLNARHYHYPEPE